MDIVFVTNNKNKLSEIKNLVSSDYNILSLEDINFNQEIEETKNTLEANALLKARYIHSKYGCNCFADDTGLEIDYLNGAPGVFSARYAGPKCLAKDNIDKVLLKLKGVKNRQAKFRTIIALILENKEYTFEGECIGNISLKQKGKNGFGYDPIFTPNNFDLSFAQMSDAIKNKVSHRAKAVKKLVHFLSITKLNKS
tara:strand:- start:130 stop:720 length:591 start_codon:yes stop_codon:yes gene_type:complete